MLRIILSLFFLQMAISAQAVATFELIEKKYGKIKNWEPNIDQKDPHIIIRSAYSSLLNRSTYSIINPMQFMHVIDNPTHAINFLDQLAVLLIAQYPKDVQGKIHDAYYYNSGLKQYPNRRISTDHSLLNFGVLSSTLNRHGFDIYWPYKAFEKARTPIIERLLKIELVVIAVGELLSVTNKYKSPVQHESAYQNNRAYIDFMTAIQTTYVLDQIVQSIDFSLVKDELITLQTQVDELTYQSILKHIEQIKQNITGRLYDRVAGAFQHKDVLQTQELSENFVLPFVSEVANTAMSIRAEREQEMIEKLQEGSDHHEFLMDQLAENLRSYTIQQLAPTNGQSSLTSDSDIYHYINKKAIESNDYMMQKALESILTDAKPSNCLSLLIH